MLQRFFFKSQSKLLELKTVLSETENMLDSIDRFNITELNTTRKSELGEQ